MSWWGWIVIGTLLFAAELFAIDAQFYLIFIGSGAITVGLALFIGLDLPVWAQWLSFAGLSLASMFALRRKVYEKLRGAGQALGGAVGKIVVVPEELAPGGSCRAEFRGSTWKTVNVGKEVIPAEGKAVIDVVEGLTLHVRSVG
jgi:membrane protein implicated in regulation of membrane protease activity